MDITRSHPPILAQSAFQPLSVGGGVPMGASADAGLDAESAAGLSAAVGVTLMLVGRDTRQMRSGRLAFCDVRKLALSGRSR